MRKIIAGNWKMNLNILEGLELIRQITGYCEKQELGKVEVLVAPPFIHLSEATKITSEKNLIIAAQDCSEYSSGAYTGEVSASMLHSMDITTVIVGHSERREYFNESDEVVNRKLKLLHNENMLPILCVGEKLEDRRAGRQEEIVKRQLQSALKNFSSAEVEGWIIAYEPVWAIGTGETASPEQAQEMHNFIRRILTQDYGEEIALSISLLYGGSVKPGNAAGIFSQPDVDGGLIGGASLKFEDFTSLIKAGVEML